MGKCRSSADSLASYFNRQPRTLGLISEGE